MLFSKFINEIMDLFTSYLLLPEQLFVRYTIFKRSKCKQTTKGASFVGLLLVLTRYSYIKYGFIYVFSYCLDSSLELLELSVKIL